jgi:hypothetical protein
MQGCISVVIRSSHTELVGILLYTRLANILCIIIIIIIINALNILSHKQGNCVVFLIEALKWALAEYAERYQDDQVREKRRKLLGPEAAAEMEMDTVTDKTSLKEDEQNAELVIPRSQPRSMADYCKYCVPGALYMIYNNGSIYAIALMGPHLFALFCKL